MRTTDISKYKEDNKKTGLGAIPAPVKTVLSCALKVLLTTLLITFIAGIIVCFNVLIYLFNLAAQPSGIDLDARSLNQSSFVYVQDPKSGEFVEYQILYGTENREWVDYGDIPQAMFDAIISIEDKRFEEHNGVDWLRTGSAVLNLVSSGDDSYGGSTITQQLIKNLTKDDEASINRKIREIVKALKVEQEYTKDEIIEAYLNVVNFGGSCQGVQAAANRYFDKDITDCTIAQCAAIAGITQNPSKWDPLIYPDNNKIRREIIINEMYAQEKITEAEYNQAMEESANMVFSDGGDEEDPLFVGDIQNWYQDELVFDVAADLAEYYNISEDAAIDKLYTEGYTIYSAMDVNAQKIIEEEALNLDKSSDPDLEIAMSLIGLDGRVIASVGSSNKKEGNLVFDRATMSTLQPGSSIKPVVAYPYAVDRKLLNYSAVVPDQPLENWVYDDGTHGPTNWYWYYNKNGLLLVDAIEWSSNACAAQALEMIGGPTTAYNHATTFLGFEHLNPDVDPYAYAGFSLGGMNGGITVREMANAYTYIANGGKHYEPYTYYYVTDQRGNVILDNRNNTPLQAYSQDTATIMNRMLNYNVNHCKNTHAWRAAIYGWEICGKTGTTNSDKDSWFCGTSPYASLAVWTGYDDPEHINDTSVTTNTWNKVMKRYLEDKEYKDYELSPGVITEEYCTYTGRLASDTCKDTMTGYYTPDNMPGKCLSHNSSSVGANKEETTAPPEETEPVTTEPDYVIDIPIIGPQETTTEPGEATVPTEPAN